jgi:anaerobic magnesium-protoporphyrin IX monomethyl ester cyclase
MVDVLLAHSFFLKHDPKQVEKMKPYAPLGTLYAASHVRQQGFSVALFDAMLSEGLHEYEALLKQLKPAVVALYEDQFNFLNKMCLAHTRDAACRMSRLARDHGARVVAAGADVSDHPEIYFDHGVECALVGEPDRSFSRVVASLLGAEARPLSGIPGVVLPAQAGGVSHTPSPVAVEPERDPDRFAFPAWDLLDVERYRAAWSQVHGYFSLNMVSTRGCPFHCNWCAKPIWGQRYAMRSPANVAEEMAAVKHTLSPDHVWFADDIFGLQPQWVVEFAHEVEEREASIPFMIQSRVDLMTEKAVAALARAGCVEVWLGVESGSQKVLDAMDKGTTLPQIRTARARLRQAGIKASFFIQLGYPGETFDDIMATVRLVRELLPDQIGVSVSYPLPGTKFYGMVAHQLGAKDHWRDSDELAMMFQGTYHTSFYRKLHALLHRDLEMRHRLAGGAPASAELLADLDRLAEDWYELGTLEAGSRSTAPTGLHRPDRPLEAPDLTERRN